MMIKAGMNLSAGTGMVLAGLVKVGTAGMVAIGEGDGDSDEDAFLHGLAGAGSDTPPVCHTGRKLSLSWKCTIPRCIWCGASCTICRSV